jgi:uncharacterized protein (TIGR03084 family)
MPVDLAQLLTDLRDETEVVDGLISELEASQWNLPTPAEGWSITDQVSHLAYFDDAAILAASDPGRFRAEAEVLVAHGPDFTESVAERYHALPPAELLAWFRRSRAHYLETFATLDPGARLPWYGPSMSAAISVTARLMETWAHGLDIADAVGRTTPPSMRLRHVAHLGVATFGFAFRSHGLDVPDTAVRFELDAPDGTTWTWGDPGAAERVAGPALDFCLVATQRRHPDDTGLTTTGAVAAKWLTIAQAFAGPPGSGRYPLERVEPTGPSDRPPEVA